MSKVLTPERKIFLAETINQFKDTPYVGDGYRRFVPELEVDEKGNVVNFTDFSNIMVNGDYEVIPNEFFSALINKIAKTVVIAMSAANPLAAFKGQSLVKGATVEMIFNNPAVAEDMGPVNDANNLKSFKTYKPDTKVSYLNQNRADVYPVTVSDVDARKAFQSIEALDQFITQLVNTLVTGDEIDEFLWTKKLVVNAVDQNLVRTQVVSPLTSDQALRTFIAKLKALSVNFGLASKNYNAYTNFPGSMGNPATVVTAKENIAIIVRSDVMAAIDVEVLATAFNMEKSQFESRIAVVDEFDGNDNIMAVMCDAAWLQIHDIEKRMTSQFIARTAVTNWFLRCQAIFGINPFANAVVLLDDEDGLPEIAATDIVVDSTTVTVGDVHNFRYDPANATETISLKNTSTGTCVIDNDNKTFKALTAGTLIFQLVSNGAVVSDTVTASA